MGKGHADAVDPLEERLDAAHVFGAFFESAPDAVVIIDDQGRIIRVNAQTEAMFSYSRDDLIGRPIEFLMPSRFQQAHQKHRGAYVADPRTRPMGAGLELYGRRADGSEFPVDISLSPMHTNGEMLSSAAIRDVTERKRLEAARDAFIANAAHELRTPLATLAMLGETLATRMQDMSEHNRTAALDALRRQSERASTLVTNLLDLSQIDAGRASMKLQPTPVERVVRNAVESAPAPEGKRVSVEITDPVAVSADPIRLEQVVTNLLVNAYRYGGSDIRVSASGNDREANIVVEDDGPGIPDYLEQDLFEPFTRGRDAAGVGGSGIGLAICRGLVGAFGGTLRHERRKPSGARFIISLERV